MEHEQYDRILADEQLRAEIVSRLGLPTAPAPPPAGATRSSASAGTVTLERQTAPPASADGPQRWTEAIVLRFGRPSLLVRGDSFEVPLSDTWRERLYPSQRQLETAIRSVGRVEVSGVGGEFVGTAWVVAPGVAVTNRHVALLFARGTGTDVAMRSDPAGRPYTPSVDFAEEHGPARSHEVRVASVLYIADDDDRSPDLAFLRLDGPSSLLPAPIPLARRAASAGQVVAAIGYPAQDWRNDPSDQARIFEGVFDVKRLAPGEVVTADAASFTHDCTTLGGSSGSVVVDVATGEAVGLHFAGRYLEANVAVTAASIRDHLRNAGISALATSPHPSLPAPRPEPTPAPEVLEDRQGYAEDFLGAGELRVPLPELSGDLFGAAVVVDEAAAGRGRITLDYEHFSVVMHAERRLATFTASNIDGDRLQRIKREKDRWSFDPRIDPRFQIGEELYRGNDLDRGHLVRRLDPAWGDTAQAKRGAGDTFFFTNCSPQHATFNQQLWLELEDYLLDNAETRGFTACVFTGPVFDAGDPTYRGLQLPRAFWKVATMVHDQRDALTATGYLVSQADLVQDLEFVFGQVRTYQVPLRRLEVLTGLDFGTLRDADPLAEVEAAAAPRELRTPEDLVL